MKPTTLYFDTFRFKCFVYDNKKENLRIFDEKEDEGISLEYSSLSKEFKALNKKVIVVKESILIIFDKLVISMVDVDKLAEDV